MSQLPAEPTGTGDKFEGDLNLLLSVLVVLTLHRGLTENSTDPGSYKETTK